MNYSPFPINNGKDDDDDFLNLTLSIRTTSPPSSKAATAALPFPELPYTSSLTSITPPSSSNLTSSSSITPRSSNLTSSSSIAPPNSNPTSSPSITPRSYDPFEFDPTLYHHQIWYHQHTIVGSPSYHGGMTVGGAWFYQPTAMGGPSYHQYKEVGGPWVCQPTTDPSHPQPTSVGGSSHSQPTAVGDLPADQPTVVESPSQQQPVSVGGPSRHQITAVRAGKIRKNRMKRRTSIRLKPGKMRTIPPPYPWATERRAILHDLQYIQSKGINTIAGRVKCTECHREFDIEYDLQTKFQEVQLFVIENKDAMSQRAPEVWRSPTVPDCKFCNQKKCAKPIWGKRRSINWLFLLLGQMIGCCKLAELKYFCKHTRNHRTGAKDRVLYATYLELCRQLDPEGDYDP
ncbi:hypothetical protein CDL12_29245 [Handroanthus impetiginosus]|uniref:DUF7086 domain-containing protein n=1 Tax=Handroanthus impetiginosus TaxID=429701 RepID=A0A2G9FYY3_9LAMI|nr:hypothetical protein CDL12_29245 [Handroanthus impetiginosus]